MRLFLAVDPDEAASGAVARAAERLRRRAEARERTLARAVTWVQPGNLHLTLHFLGEVDEVGLAGVRTALDPPLAAPPMRVELGEWGVFPPAGPARVIWIGLSAGAAALARLHAELAGRLRQAGIAADDRPFSPHLTIGRVKQPGRADWGALARSVPPAACGFEVVSCTLYRSHLAGARPSYEPLLRIPLEAPSTGVPGTGGTLA